MEGVVWLGPLGLIMSFAIFNILKGSVVPGFCYWGGVHSPAVDGASRTFKENSSSPSLRECDILEISMLVLTWLIGVATSVVSVVVFTETMEDTLLARSTVLIPYCHFASWYYIVDTYAMYLTFVTKRNLSPHGSLKARLWRFVQVKWSSLLHHLLLMTVGYPVIVNPIIRGYKGDFYAAALLAQDFSNPFLAQAKILKIVGLIKTMGYAINGVLLVLVFLVVRVLNMPLCVLVYAWQYHGGNVWVALGHLRWSCYGGILIVIIMQSYWFLSLSRLAWDVVRSRWKDRIK